MPTFRAHVEIATAKGSLNYTLRQLHLQILEKSHLTMIPSRLKPLSCRLQNQLRTLVLPRISTRTSRCLEQIGWQFETFTSTMRSTTILYLAASSSLRSLPTWVSTLCSISSSLVYQYKVRRSRTMLTTSSYGRKTVKRWKKTTPCSKKGLTILMRHVRFFVIYFDSVRANMCTDPVCLTDENPLVRTISLATGTRTKAFTDAVRSRDGQCVISGRPVKRRNGVSSYISFQASHVFPLAYEGDWVQQNLGRWITEIPSRGGSINSVQNGLLLSNEMHALFDTYCLSINPDVRASILIRLSSWLHLRITTKLCVSLWMLKIMPIESFLRNFWVILYVLQTSFCGGTSGKLCWRTWRALASQLLNTTFHQVLILWKIYGMDPEPLNEWNLRCSVV